jgi:hypothetical protein
MSDTTNTLKLCVPHLIPDNRVRTGSHDYLAPTSLGDLLEDAAWIYGVVGGVDHRGAEWLRSLLEGPRQLSGLIVLALYAGSPTWDDVLRDVPRFRRSAKAGCASK